jgi:hypothetical protein
MKSKPSPQFLATMIPIIVFVFTPAIPAHAQYTETLNIGAPGIYTGSPLIADAAGNFYGSVGGGTGECYPYGCGQIFQLPAGSQTPSIIYQFTGTTDGSGPTGRLTVDAKGNVYGVTTGGGNLSYCGGSGCGVVFELSPASGGAWTETVLYAFTETTDGGFPYGGVVFDAEGNLYGAAGVGGEDICEGKNNCGEVYELSPNSTGGWTQTVIHSFHGTFDGGPPVGLLTLDKHGNVYGATTAGGNTTACQDGCGTLFLLTPVSGGKWSYNRLYEFDGAKGQNPTGFLVFDKVGNLYGATEVGGKTGSGCPLGTCGTVFELAHLSNGTWRQSVLHSFTGGPDGSTPSNGGVTLDTAGNVYGTAAYGGIQDCGSSGYPPGCGTAYKISPASGGGWIFDRIYGFTGFDGEIPNGSLLLDASGNLYGTSVVGYDGYGNIFELSPPADEK